MKLIGSKASPYVRKVRVVMAEKKLDYRLELEDVWSSDTRIAQVNPLGQVPCLVLDDGEALFDSRVIVEYLDTLSPVAPWRIVNIGGGEPVGLLPFIETIENCLDKRAIRKMQPMQAGDMQATYADPRLLEALTGYRPRTSVEEGVAAFIRWYLEEWPSRPTIAA